MRKADVVVDELDQTSELLMYLAGELPHRQRMALEKRLAADPALARELETLRDLQSDFDAQMHSLDDSKRIRGQEMAVARIGRAMQMHGVNQEAAYETLAPRRVLRMPAWAYPIAAAAAIVLIYVGWWTHQPTHDAQTVARVDVASKPQGQGSAASDQEQVMFAELAESFRNHNPTQRRSLDSLSHAESELATLASPTRESLDDPFINSPILDNEE